MSFFESALRKSRIRSSVILALPFAWLASLLCSSAAQADALGWVLTQKSQSLGDQYVYISPDGLRCVNPKAGFAMVTKAPDWTIYMFNDKTHVFYTNTLAGYRKELDSRGFTSQMAGKCWARSGHSGNIAGLRATQYVMTGNNRNFAKTVGRSGGGGDIKAADYWVSNDIGVPPAISELLATAYGLPPTHNVPLRITMMNADSKAPFTVLETYRMSPSTIPKSYFTYPAGYRQVQSDAEVLMNADQKQMIDDMTRDIGDLSAPSSSSSSSYSGSSPSSSSSSASDLSKLLNDFNKTKK